MNVNVVIVGHVDHGKSTLIGRLLYDSQSLPDDKLAEIQKLLEEYKKRFEFAYFLDSFEEELKEERTIDTTRVLFKGQNYYSIVDVPGHKEFIKNMLTGACHAQVAILVISAPEGIQEQTKRHAFLVQMLGIKDILVAVNKMDLVNYAEDIFLRLTEESHRLLSQLGYSGVTFIPISAMEGDNIYKPSDRMLWYHGPRLIQALDNIRPETVSERPLRFIVQDIYPLASEKIVVGKVEAGTLREKDTLIFQPSCVQGTVGKILVYPHNMEEAISGDSVGIVIDCEVKRGDVGGRHDSPPISRSEFLGEVVLLEGVLKQGDELELKCGTKRTRCIVKQINERISSETGEVMDKNPGEIEENDAATIVFQTEPIVLENFSDIPELGRFVLASNAKNIAAGVVLGV